MSRATGNAKKARSKSKQKAKKAKQKAKKNDAQMQIDEDHIQEDVPPSAAQVAGDDDDEMVDAQDGSADARSKLKVRISEIKKRRQRSKIRSKTANRPVSDAKKAALKDILKDEPLDPVASQIKLMPTRRTKMKAKINTKIKLGAMDTDD